MCKPARKPTKGRQTYQRPRWRHKKNQSGMRCSPTYPRFYGCFIYLNIYIYRSLALYKIHPQFWAKYRGFSRYDMPIIIMSHLCEKQIQQRCSLFVVAHKWFKLQCQLSSSWLFDEHFCLHNYSWKKAEPNRQVLLKTTTWKTPSERQRHWLNGGWRDDMFTHTHTSCILWLLYIQVTCFHGITCDKLWL